LMGTSPGVLAEESIWTRRPSRRQCM